MSGISLRDGVHDDAAAIGTRAPVPSARMGFAPTGLREQWHGVTQLQMRLALAS